MTFAKTLFSDKGLCEHESGGDKSQLQTREHLGVELAVAGRGVQIWTVCRTEADVSVSLGYSQSFFFEPGSLTEPETR